jgi:hypothetical protein
MSQQARLVVEGRGNWVYTHPIPEGGRVSIGRGAENDVDLGDLHASTRHAEIVADGRGFVLRDLGSRNGTLLNGEKVKEAKLRHGADIRIGATSMSFLTDKDESFTTASAPMSPPAQKDPGAALEPILERLDDLRSGLDSASTPGSGEVLSQAVEGLQIELKEARATIDRLNKVNEFIRLLGTPDLAPVQLLSGALYFMCTEVKGENGFIMQIDPKSKKWSVRCRFGEIRDWESVNAAEGQQLPMSLTLVEEALRTGQPVITQSALDDPRFIEAKSIGFLGIQTCLCYPLFRDGKPEGVAYTDRRDSHSAFTSAEEKLFHALTSQLNQFLYPAPRDF